MCTRPSIIIVIALDEQAVAMFALARFAIHVFVQFVTNRKALVGASLHMERFFPNNPKLETLEACFIRFLYVQVFVHAHEQGNILLGQLFVALQEFTRIIADSFFTL